MVIPAYRRPDALGVTLDRLSELPIGEVIVVDNSPSSAEIRGVVSGREGVRLIAPERNLGVDARNLAARAASGEFLLSLDDDSYPLPGAVEAMVRAMRMNPSAAVVAGSISDRDRRGRPVGDEEVGSWDWWLRCGQVGEPGPAGFESNFFSEGASMFRRSAFLSVGGWFAPFFHLVAELDLAIRLIGAGWEIRYLPGARFRHMRKLDQGGYSERSLYYRTRNHVWYFWLRFPALVAARRIPAYLLVFLAEGVSKRQARVWARAVADTWRQRSHVADARRPFPRSVVRRAERDRGRRVLRLLVALLGRRLQGPPSPTQRGDSSSP